MAIPRKTMRDIRTLSGRVDRIANPYMAYMQITCLEMEKARKGRERASALQRAEILDGRLRDIETEKAALVRALAEREAAPVAAPANLGSRPAPSRISGGLTLRY
jgi:hypothetical protein